MTDSMYDSEKDLPLHKGRPYRLCSDVFRMATMSKGACALICIDECTCVVHLYTVIVILSENIIQQNTSHVSTNTINKPRLRARLPRSLVRSLHNSNIAHYFLHSRHSWGGVGVSLPENRLQMCLGHTLCTLRKRLRECMPLVLGDRIQRGRTGLARTTLDTGLHRRHARTHPGPDMLGSDLTHSSMSESLWSRSQELSRLL